MIDRYALPRMSAIWSQHHKYELWLHVELVVCEILEQTGQVPKGVAERIRRKARIKPERIAKIEKTVKHDIIAFLDSIAEQVGDEARHLHAGLTSSDILDTALALQTTEAVKIIFDDIDALLAVLKRHAYDHRDTIMVGRSHGIHGEPISFGLKFALWYDEFCRQRERLVVARDDMAVGKLSGAMGTFAHLRQR